jgi:iodotyrosine deiodinase
MKAKLIDGYPYLDYSPPTKTDEDILKTSIDYFEKMSKRRSVRDFSDKDISIEVIKNIVKTAGTAPSGANKQPWTFCIVKDSEIKSKIRLAAEQEEKESYEARMSKEWLEDLKPLGTNWQKPFLETAPYLIVVFKKVYDLDERGQKRNNYYVQESLGIACGILISAIQNAGLVTLTHTPSPMNFLSKILNRPSYEKPYLLLPVGHPASECWVPDIQRKNIEEITEIY